MVFVRNDNTDSVLIAKQWLMYLNSSNIKFYLFFFQIRYDFGCYDEICEVEDRLVRHCNWIRFSKSSTNIKDVNFLATIVQGEPLYQTIRQIKPNDEIVVFFDQAREETIADDTVEEIDVVGVEDDGHETSKFVPFEKYYNFWYKHDCFQKQKYFILVPSRNFRKMFDIHCNNK